VDIVVVVTAGAVEVEVGRVDVVEVLVGGWTAAGGCGALDPAVVGAVVDVVAVGTALTVVDVVEVVGAAATGGEADAGGRPREPRREAEGVSAGLPSRAIALTAGETNQITVADVKTVRRTPGRSTCCPTRPTDIALHTVRQEQLGQMTSVGSSDSATRLTHGVP